MFFSTVEYDRNFVCGVILQIHLLKMMQTLKNVRHLATATMKHTVTEFRMPVPWGEMRGRAWGPDHGRPVLCLHGWSDNCGSFNTLIPLLPADWRCVAVDLPGHGFSSHRPAGIFYTFPAYITDITDDASLKLYNGNASP
ncbi:hypothetical protein PHYPO_G00153120 [Pangasianodon hypophthalmus]|uniref:AB hydrolase-1 domain-containing protein n=1 Tax=Pangasianodon hypophthalmus TaxID=310915 RepID=A0A5N5K8Q9_PANHP|nr:hypothetical protein PHYPO_G00153120 [Pangasianodon hypophthalmus]